MPFNTGRIVQSQLAKPCVGTEELFDGCITQLKLTSNCIINNHLTNGCVATHNIVDGNITQVKLASNSVGINQLKTSTGTWSLLVSGIASVNLVDYSFFPKQRTSNENILLWYYMYYTSEAYILFSQGSGGYWYGTYRYVTASEQIVEVYRDISTNKVIGVHVTERGNDNSVHYYNNNKIEISVRKEVYNYINTPNLFEEKICKLTATKIMNNLLEEKVIDERD